MDLFVINNIFVFTLLIAVAFLWTLSAADLSESFASTSNQSTNSNNDESQTDLASLNAAVPSTEFENSTILLTATRIGTEGNNYIWTSEGRNSPVLNLRPNTDYEFIVNTMPEDQNEHELKISTIEGEEIAEGESVDEGESSNFIFNSGQPRTLSYFCEYHPTSMIGPIDIIQE